MKNSSSKKYKILDLFSGAGGFSHGIDSLDEFETVVANDFNEAALNTLKLNSPYTETIFGDITKKEVKDEIIKKSKELGVNMIIGGPPCQGFSLQGKKLGIEDPRNFLFMEYLKLVQELQPEIFVIENVKNMAHSNDGYFIKQIIEKFSKEGYNITYEIMKARELGAPQKRERAIVIGSKYSKIIFDYKKVKKETTVRDAISDLAYLESGEGSEISEYTTKPESKYQREMRKGSTQLHNHKATNHSELAIKKLKMIPIGGDKTHLPEELRGRQKFNSTWSRLLWDDLSPTIDTRFDTPSNGQNSHPYLDRSITPREAARLQTFPDTYIFTGKKTEICKQIGNAVPPILARTIGEIILKNNTSEISEEKNGKSKLINADSYSYVQNLVSSKTLVDHIITDPPYNISQNNNFNTMSNRKGLDFGGWDWKFDLTGWIEEYDPILKEGGSTIIFCSFWYISYIVDKLKELGYEIKDCIRWIKSNPMPRNRDRRYVSDYEFAVWAVKPGKKKWVFNRQEDVPYHSPEYKTGTVSGKERTEHPTQKSLKMMEDLIKIHTNEGDIILDPFVGSGTTAVAAKKNNRNFIAIEKDKKYFEIAKMRISEIN